MAGSATSLYATLGLERVSGPIFIGALLSMSLWAVVCVEAFAYFSHSRKDHVVLRATIGLLVLLDTVHTAFVMHSGYYYLISNFDKPELLLIPIWSILLHVPITAVVNFIIRGLFVHRIFMLSKGVFRYIATLPILLISLANFAVGMVLTVKLFQLPNLVAISLHSQMIYFMFVSMVAADLGVTFALCWLLLKARTGFGNTNRVIGMLITFTVNTGLIVSLDAVAALIAYAVMPDNLVFFGLYLTIGKLYIACYLASVNAREGLRGKLDEPLPVHHLSEISTPRSRPYDLEDHSGSVLEKGSIRRLPPLQRQEHLAISVSTEINQYFDGQSSASRGLKYMI